MRHPPPHNAGLQLPHQRIKSVASRGVLVARPIKVRRDTNVRPFIAQKAEAASRKGVSGCVPLGTPSPQGVSVSASFMPRLALQATFITACIVCEVRVWLGATICRCVGYRATRIAVVGGCVRALTQPTRTTFRQPNAVVSRTERYELKLSTTLDAVCLDGQRVSRSAALARPKRSSFLSKIRP